jgi:hypothetical protein
MMSIEEVAVMTDVPDEVQRGAPFTMLAVHAIFESAFWRRLGGEGRAWLDALVRL